MLSVNTLQPPKTGRSRFSKALPAVPGLDNDLDDYYTTSPTSPPKGLPDLPPAPPPPRSDSMANAKSLNSALPTLPLLTIANAPPSGPPTMAIPRRPVGKPAQAPRPQQDSQVVSPIEPVSPAFSLSSILSAYSRSSGESLVRSSDVATSARESEATISPNDEVARGSNRTEGPMASFTGVKANELPRTQNVAPTPIMDDAPPPPPPSKDDKYHLPASPAPASVAKPDPSKQHIDNPSPPRQPQIWRRRSLKAERSLELPDLKLISTNGSTAATQPLSQPTQSQLPALKVTPLPLQPPRSTGGLPGRNIRPAPPPPPPKEQVADAQVMGNSTSKLKNLKNKLQAFHRKEGSTSDTTVETAARPGTQRPPTPEYQKQDVKTPIIDTFVSPVSPASSPEPPTEVSPVLPKELPREPSAGAASVESKPISRKAIPIPPQALPAPTPDSSSKKALPELRVVTQTPAVTEPFPDITPSAVGNRGSGGSDAASASSRTQQSAEVAKFPPRKSSKASMRSVAPRAVEQPRQSHPELDPRLVPSESQGFLYRGRDGTLYPEMKELQNPDPRAYYFPKRFDQPIVEGDIIRAPPLKDSHYNCYHGHKTMNRRTNRYYPLTCQTCDKADDEDRWSCTFCHLRICEGCLKGLKGHQRDLRLFVHELSQKA
ncbi:Fc.00g111600.m01.CDS01 [Cosmosporella sp. VM-42]